MPDFNTNGIMRVGGLVVGPNDDWGIAFGNDSTLKIVRSPFAGDATKVYAQWNSAGSMTSGPTYSTVGTAGFQTVAGDLNLGATAGSSTTATPAYLGGGMFNLVGTGGNSATKNILAGLIGKIDLAGTISSTYAAAALRAEVGDGVTGAYANVLAVLGGDTAATTATSAFACTIENSTGSSGWTYGLDLAGPTAAETAYIAPRFTTADIRLASGGLIVSLTSAITANTTTTTLAAGTLAKTTNATGRASLFVSDGSKWQFLTNA